MMRNMATINIVGKNIVVLRTNVARIYGFNYAPYVPQNFDIHMPHNAILTLTFNVTSISKCDCPEKARDLITKVSEHCYLSSDKEIICFRDAKLLRFVMKIKITNDNIHIMANKPFYDIIRLPVGGLYPPGMHLSTLTYVKLLQQGYLTLHAAAVDVDDKASLLIAHSNTGKTMTSFMLAKKGYKILGDDIVVVDVKNKTVYAVPYAQTYLHNRYIIDGLYKCGHISSFERMKFMLNLKFSDIPILPFYVNFKPPQKIYYLPWFKNASRLEKVIILKRSKKDKGIQELDFEQKKKLLGELININNIEFGWIRDPIVFSLRFLEGREVTIQKLFKKELDLIAKTLMNATVFIVYTKNPFEFPQLVDEALREA